MKIIHCVVIAIAAIGLGVSAGAHPATERYVPIGYWESVGVKNTYVGTVADVAEDASKISYRHIGKSKSARITRTTRIYVDRSHMGLRNRDGTRADLRAGLIMEIKPRADDAGVAEWIKVRADR